MMIKKLDYSTWEKYLTKDITTDFIIGFQCDCCGKVFRCIEDLRFSKLPLDFPTLEYSTPSNYNSNNYELNFCSLVCLNSLLEKVPFSFEIRAPFYFGSMNRRDKRFYEDWEILEI